jgi:hypothetical protein
MGCNCRIFVTFCYKSGELVQKLNLKKENSVKKVLYVHYFLLREESRPIIRSVTLSGHLAVFVGPSHSVVKSLCFTECFTVNEQLFDQTLHLFGVQIELRTKLNVVVSLHCLSALREALPNYYSYYTETTEMCIMDPLPPSSHPSPAVSLPHSSYFLILPSTRKAILFTRRLAVVTMLSHRWRSLKRSVCRQGHSEKYTRHVRKVKIYHV